MQIALSENTEREMSSQLNMLLEIFRNFLDKLLETGGNTTLWHDIGMDRYLSM